MNTRDVTTPSPAHGIAAEKYDWGNQETPPYAHLQLSNIKEEGEKIYSVYTAGRRLRGWTKIKRGGMGREEDESVAPETVSGTVIETGRDDDSRWDSGVFSFLFIMFWATE